MPTRQEFIDQHRHRLMGMVYDVLKSPQSGAMYSREIERCIFNVTEILAKAYDDLIPPPPPAYSDKPPVKPPTTVAAPKTTF